MLDKIIYNNNMEFDLTRCKHGIETHSCYICSGQADIDYLEQKEKKDRKKVVSEELQRWIDDYNKVEYLFKDIRVLWVREEVELVWDELMGVTNKVKFRIACYELALTLERSYGAIVWEYKHLSIDKPYHRSKVTIDFLKEKGIEYKSE